MILTFKYLTIRRIALKPSSYLPQISKKNTLPLPAHIELIFIGFREL
jgi:hypothetical protein